MEKQVGQQESDFIPAKSSRKPKIPGHSGRKMKKGFVKVEVEPGVIVRMRQNLRHDMDPKKLKKLIKNRVSAHKSRIKKDRYVAELEKQAEKIEKRVAVLIPQVARYREYKQHLEEEQAELKRKIAELEVHSQRVECEIAANTAEVTRLLGKMAIQKELEGAGTESGYLNMDNDPTPAGPPQPHQPPFNPASAREEDEDDHENP